MSVHTPVYMNNQLFGCTDDVGDCLYACFCGSCHIGSIAQRTGTGDCFGTCCINNIAGMLCPWIGGIVHGGSVFKSALLRVGGDGPARYDRVHLLLPVLAVPGQPRDQRSTSGGGGEPAGWRPATASDRRSSAAGASGLQVSESSTSDREG